MSETIKRTQEELVSELRARFGDNPLHWAFECPQCHDIATGWDFRHALDMYGETNKYASDYLGQQCIGRVLGSLSKTREKWEGRGCDWAAFGLFRGPDFAIAPDGTEIPCFPIAPAPDNGVEGEVEQS